MGNPPGTRAGAKLRYLFLGRAGLKSLATEFFSAIGLAAAIITLTATLTGLLKPTAWRIGAGLIVVLGAAMWALWRAMPRLAIRGVNADGVTATIRVGDLFAEPGDIAIGCNDHFVGSERSLLGTLISSDPETELQLQSALSERHAASEPDQYPIGTVVSVGSDGRSVYLFAFAEMRSDGSTIAPPDSIWVALVRLWETVRAAGAAAVAIPVIGSGLGAARAPRLSLISLLLISFTMVCRDARVCRELSIIIAEDDLGPDDIAESELLLRQLGYSTKDL